MPDESLRAPALPYLLLDQSFQILCETTKNKSELCTLLQRYSTDRFHSRHIRCLDLREHNQLFPKRYSRCCHISNVTAMWQRTPVVSLHIRNPVEPHVSLWGWGISQDGGGVYRHYFPLVNFFDRGVWEAFSFSWALEQTILLFIGN